VTFLHAGGLYQKGKHPKNVGSYFGYIDEAQYIAGVVAGHTSRSGKLGFVAAKPIPQVLRNINALHAWGAVRETAVRLLLRPMGMNPYTSMQTALGGAQWSLDRLRRMG